MENTPMSNTSNPDPDLTAVPNRGWFAGLSLALSVSLVGHLLITPGVSIVLAGFVVAFVLPFVLAVAVLRAIVVLSMGVERVCRKDLTLLKTVPDRAAPENVD